MEAVLVDLRSDVHAHLAARREDIDRAVVIGTEIHAERRGRSAELIDFLFEGLDLLAFGAQHGGELLVLRERTRELRLRLEYLLLQQLDLTWGVGESSTKECDLVFEELHLRLQLVDLLLVPLLLFPRIETCHP